MYSFAKLSKVSMFYLFLIYIFLRIVGDCFAEKPSAQYATMAVCGTM
jgi:hypothetical protein